MPGSLDLKDLKHVWKREEWLVHSQFCLALSDPWSVELIPLLCLSLDLTSHLPRAVLLLESWKRSSSIQ